MIAPGELIHYTSVKGHELILTNVSRRLSMKDLRSIKRAELINKLQLRKSIEEIERYFPFIERLEKASADILKQVSLFSFQCVEALGAKHSEVLDALMTDAEICKRPLKDLQGKKNLKILVLRLRELRTSPEKIREVSAKELLKKKIPDEAYALLTENQLMDVDFSSLTGLQIDWCMGGGIEDRETIETRFLFLSEDQLLLILDRASEKILQFFPILCLRRMDIRKLKKEHIDRIFCNCWLSEKEKKEKMEQIPPEFISSLATIASGKFLSCLSKEQVFRVDCHSLENSQIEALLFHPRFSENERREKVALLDGDVLNSLILRGFLKFLEILPLDRLSSIQVKNLKKEGLQYLFPSIQAKHLEKGQYTEEKEWHFWISETGAYISLSDEAVKRRIAARKERCKESFKALTLSQWSQIKSKIEPDILAFLGFLKTIRE